VIARAHRRDVSLETEQIAMFLGPHFVVTFQEREDDFLDTVRQRILAGAGRIRTCGADYLLYSILDTVIDDYFPVLEQYGEKLDALDDQVSSSGERALISEIHNVRSELLCLRRSVWPLREAINSLIRDSGDLISDETGLYLRDCYDHTVQIIDVIETDRELCADLRDFYLTIVSNRMNQVMKFLTIIATLFIPLGFIAGLYGMNFNPKASPWNMPELNWTLGYPFALAVMAATSASLIVVFWRKGWLG
jgi:magnesium transporter